MPSRSSYTLLSQGAEATLERARVLGREVVFKTRVPKTYRHASLDARIRKERTHREARMMHHAKEVGVLTPLILSVDENACCIVMEYVDAPRLKNILSSKKTPLLEKRALCEEMGKIIARLHAQNVIHGDVTTSNFLARATKKVKTKSKENSQLGYDLVVIDFGLASLSNKTEDKAVDLVNLKKTFEATHSTIEKGWEAVLHGYVLGGGKKETLSQMEKVESRIRYA